MDQPVARVLRIALEYEGRQPEAVTENPDIAARLTGEGLVCLMTGPAELLGGNECMGKGKR